MESNIIMKKETTVVMLPTEDKTQLYTRGVSFKNLFLNPSPWYASGRDKNQHLYITVDQKVEPIKEGDWFITIQNHIFKCTRATETSIYFLQHDDGYEYSAEPKRCRKIIATTDTKLGIPCKCKSKCDLCTGEHILYGIQQSVIEEFCRKGGIYKVLVEYDNINQRCATHMLSKEECSYGCTLFTPGDNKLKLNSDNTINISSIKDSCSIEELRTVCHKHPNDSVLGAVLRKILL